MRSRRMRVGHHHVVHTFAPPFASPSSSATRAFVHQPPPNCTTRSSNPSTNRARSTLGTPSPIHRHDSATCVPPRSLPTACVARRGVQDRIHVADEDGPNVRLAIVQADAATACDLARVLGSHWIAPRRSRHVEEKRQVPKKKSRGEDRRSGSRRIPKRKERGGSRSTDQAAARCSEHVRVAAEGRVRRRTGACARPERTQSAQGPDASEQTTRA
mmetsp:Transcript_9720/g.34500  ORF Transcript_9720/g.34500 Transcript_9720/m.34500 type:complete len:215 (+) Transcript_9720:984-1628(+)